MLGQNVMIKLINDQPFNESELKKYKKAKSRAEERYLATLFIKGLSENKYLRMKTELANQCSWGSNSYPSTVTEAYDMAMTYRIPDENSCRRDGGGRLQGLSFLNNEIHRIEKEYQVPMDNYGSTPHASGVTNLGIVQMSARRRRGEETTKT